MRPRTSRSDIVTLDQNVLAMLVSTPRFLDMKHYLEPFFGHLKKSQRIPNGDSPYVSGMDIKGGHLGDHGHRGGSF